MLNSCGNSCLWYEVNMEKLTVAFPCFIFLCYLLALFIESVLSYISCVKLEELSQAGSFSYLYGLSKYWKQLSDIYRKKCDYIINSRAWHLFYRFIMASCCFSLILVISILLLQEIYFKL